MASKNNTMASLLTAKEKTGAKRVRDAPMPSPVGKRGKEKGKKREEAGKPGSGVRATLPVSVVSIKDTQTAVCT